MYKQKTIILPLTDDRIADRCIMNDMTLRQSEVIYYKLLGLKETDIAEIWEYHNPV